MYHNISDTKGKSWRIYIYIPYTVKTRAGSNVHTQENKERFVEWRVLDHKMDLIFAFTPFPLRAYRFIV